MTTVSILIPLVNALLAADREILLQRTFWACAWVESCGDPRAYNRSEDAAGILQIRPILLLDCNRIIGREKWSLADRWNVQKSYEMFRTYCRYYHPRGTPEQWARDWAGGPDGHKQEGTKAYWAKVKQAMR